MSTFIVLNKLNYSGYNFKDKVLPHSNS